MDKRKLVISIIAGLLAALMIFGIVASILPVSAAKSSSEIKEEINDLKADKKEIEKELARLEGQLSSNLSEMKDIGAQKNVIDQQVGLLHEQIQDHSDRIFISDAGDPQLPHPELQHRRVELSFSLSYFFFATDSPALFSFQRSIRFGKIS